MISRPRVLVVDDEQNLCLLYREELESEGFIVETVNDAQAALGIVEKDPPDVVVMDIRMPNMDGVEAMGRMLNCKNDLPIILNSAFSSYKDDFRSWPAEAYVIKSADLTELKKTIRTVVAARRPRV